MITGFLRLLQRVALVVGAMLAPACAFADSACVTNGTELQNAMLQWLLMDSGTMTIKLVKGTYTLAPSNGFSSAHEVNLNILGGYRPGTGCSQRDVDPANTVLYGANSTSVRFWIHTYADVTIEGLTFNNLRYGFSLSHEIYEDATGHTWSIRYNVFRDFQVLSGYDNAGIDGGVSIDGTSQDSGVYVSFKNNLVYNIQMDGSEPAVLLTSGYNGVLSVAYNTIAFNSAPSTIGQVQPYFASELVNNILWNGAAPALKFGLDLVGPDASFNVLGPVQGILSSDVQNIYADPQWGANYHLAPGSPAINSGGGAQLVSGGFPSHDLDGNARVVGSAIDRGAYESPYDDAVDFTVMSNSDASHATVASVNCNAGSLTCTLREAIVRANASAGSSKIRFDLPCPTLITLGSPLPDITGATTIDGYTNPDAARNTSATQFDASVCVFLNGNGSVAHALHTAGSRVVPLTRTKTGTAFLPGCTRTATGTRPVQAAASALGEAFDVPDHSNLAAPGGEHHRAGTSGPRVERGRRTAASGGSEAALLKWAGMSVPGPIFYFGDNNQSGGYDAKLAGSCGSTLCARLGRELASVERPLRHWSLGRKSIAYRMEPRSEYRMAREAGGFGRLLSGGLGRPGICDLPARRGSAAPRQSSDLYTGRQSRGGGRDSAGRRASGANG